MIFLVSSSRSLLLATLLIVSLATAYLHRNPLPTVPRNIEEIFIVRENAVQPTVVSQISRQLEIDMKLGHACRHDSSPSEIPLSPYPLKSFKRKFAAFMNGK
jgi:hypothetical protein